MERSCDRCSGADTARPRAESDVTEAEAAIERLAAAPADEGLVIGDIWLLRLRSAGSRSCRCRGLCALQGSLP